MKLADFSAIHLPAVENEMLAFLDEYTSCLLYTSPSPRDRG